MKKAATLAAVLLGGCALFIAQAQPFVADQAKSEIEKFASDAFFTITSPTLAAAPEVSTGAIGVLLSIFLGLQISRHKRCHRAP